MIINADDFGRRTEVNAAIVLAFDAGLVSSTTVMANMPGFDEACQLARDRRLEAHVGVHLVLTEGEPLTAPIRRCGRFCDAAGRFVHWSATDRCLRLDAVERAAVAAEVRAQVARCRAAGLPLTHLDSHQQAHTRLGIAAVVIALAPELGLSAVRIGENARPGMSAGHRAAVGLLNARLRMADLARTRSFGTVGDLVAAQRRRGGTPDFEAMTHPVLGPDGLLVDALEGDGTLEDLVSQVEGYRSAVSYSGARVEARA